MRGVLEARVLGGWLPVFALRHLSGGVAWCDGTVDVLYALLCKSLSSGRVLVSLG